MFPLGRRETTSKRYSIRINSSELSLDNLPHIKFINAKIYLSQLSLPDNFSK